MITRAAETLSGLKARRPEWGPWLAVVELAVREGASSAWDAFVPRVDGERSAPLLADAAIEIDAKLVRGFFEKLLRAAARAGTPAMASLSAVLDRRPDVLPLLSAAIRQDAAAMKDEADRAGADGDAFQAALGLLPVPLLQACTRRYASQLPLGWLDGCCPVCAAWPAFAEVRGIERTRHFRCGRCGSEWHARPLNCPFCGEDDHGALASLVPERGPSPGTIEACRTCRGYVKVFTRLQGCAPLCVLADDLASVDLDLAAVHEGYQRRAHPAFPLTLTVGDRPSPRRRFRWQA